MTSPALKAACVAATEFFAKPIDVEYVRRNSQQRPVVRPRQFVMVWLYRTGNFSHPQIVRMLKRSDHTTSLNAQKLCEKVYGDDPLYQRLMGTAETYGENVRRKRRCPVQADHYADEANWKFVNGKGWVHRGKVAA